MKELFCIKLANGKYYRINNRIVWFTSNVEAKQIMNDNNLNGEIVKIQQG